MSIYCVQQNLVSSVWDSVEQYLSEGIKDCDAEYTLPQLKTFLTSGKWKLFVAISDKDEVHGAAAVSFISYPDNYIAFIASIGGKMLINKDYINELKDLLKSYGSNRIQGYVSESIERLYKRFSFERKSIVVEMRI